MSISNSDVKGLNVKSKLPQKGTMLVFRTKSDFSFWVQDEVESVKHIFHEICSILPKFSVVRCILEKVNEQVFRDNTEKEEICSECGFLDGPFNKSVTTPLSAEKGWKPAIKDCHTLWDLGLGPRVTHPGTDTCSTLNKCCKRGQTGQVITYMYFLKISIYRCGLCTLPHGYKSTRPN